MKLCIQQAQSISHKSLPTRERGLKYLCKKQIHIVRGVAPYTGAWIEIAPQCLCNSFQYVAPYTGAWIEILPQLLEEASLLSLPTRERGLKYYRNCWRRPPCCRSLHGSVD
ncbi:hypothetical protein [Caproicibacterium sp. XB2]|uniref:hypothetical protein n=1 Tax=Caproicibacterium sp. XB2 TaxID=3388458 RepID=UPI00385175B1